MIARQGRHFHFRRVVPARLRALVGRAEIWSSLGTTSVTVARARAGRIYGRTEDLFTVADDVIRLRQRRDIQNDERLLLQATIAEQEATLELERQASALQLELAEVRALSGEADRLEKQQARLRAVNARLAEFLPQVHELGGQLKEARRLGADAAPLVAQLRSLVATIPQVAAAADAASEPQGPSLSEVAEAFAARRISDGTLHQVVGQERSTVRRFIELNGDRPVAAYRRGDVTRFLDTLRRLPQTYGKSPKDKELSLAELIDRADAAGAERVGDKTAKRHLSALSSLFQYAVDREHLTVAARTELVEGHRFRTDEGARTQRDAWTTDELRTLFQSPVWTGCNPARRSEPGLKIVRDSKFWLPLLALYHGARLEEFADLYGRDLVHDGDTWAVRLVESVNESAAGPRRRRLKTDAATRTVPLHPEVIRIGFLDYVRRVAPERDDSLFPELLPQGKDGKRGPRITRWFVEYRRAVGVFRHGIGMHSFRHCAITRISDVITDEQQVRDRDHIMGHAREGSEGTRRYDKGPGLAAAAATLALLHYPELDFSHLHDESKEDV